MKIQGWGRYPTGEAEVLVPATRSAAISAARQGSLIPRGMGRSYGDSALAPRVLSSARLNLLEQFDQARGIVRCGAGVSLGELLDVFVPRGWFLPVTPGTKFVSVGGAIASDVHGKNHHRDGCFSEYLDSFDLLLADGEIVSCSREQHADLFHATCGGMGLTGVILQATFRLRPIRGSGIDQTVIKAGALQEALALFDAHQGAAYSVAWIDCLASGPAMGRSLVMLGEHAEQGKLAVQHKRPLSIPLDMPAQLLNRYSIRAFNALYYHRMRGGQSRRLVHYEPFFYPLDGIAHWNRLYGKRGFVQYQFVLPRAATLEGMGAILGKIANAGRQPFLAVLKAFGRQNANLLSFPAEGHTLALDLQLDDGLLALLEELDAMVLDYGGRHYLAKDARMSEATFKREYPSWEKFQAVRARYGAQGKFASQQSIRLGLD